MNKLANRDDVRTRSYELEYRLLEKEKALKAQNDLLVMETEEHERTKRSLFTVVSSAFLILISLLILRPLGAALIDIQIQNSEILLTLVTITITLIGLMYGLSGYLWRRRRQR